MGAFVVHTMGILQADLKESLANFQSIFDLRQSRGMRQMERAQGLDRIRASSTASYLPPGRRSCAVRSDLMTKARLGVRDTLANAGIFDVLLLMGPASCLPNRGTFDCRKIKLYRRATPTRISTLFSRLDATLSEFKAAEIRFRHPDLADALWRRNLQGVESEVHDWSEQIPKANDGSLPRRARAMPSP